MVSYSTEQQYDRETKISFHPLLLLLEIFSKPSCSFRTWTVSILSLHCWIKGSLDEKVLPRCGRKKAPSDSITFSLSPFLVFVFALLVCFTFLFWVSLVLCNALFSMLLFVYFFSFALFCFSYKKIEKLEKYKNNVYLCTLVLM